MVLDMLPTTAVAVPKISRLRGMINYDDDRKPLGPTFWKHFQAYREMYTTSPRIYGSTFIQWKDPGQMTGLIEMADAFLDRDKNGAKFWPDDEDADEYSNLRYSVHDRL